MQESGQLHTIKRDFSQTADADSTKESDKENREPILKESRLSFDEASEEVLSVNAPAETVKAAKPRALPNNSVRPRTSGSFKRWIEHLRPLPLKRKKTLTVRQERWPLDESPDDDKSMGGRTTHHGRRVDNELDPQSSTNSIDVVKAAVGERPVASPTSKPLRRSNLFSRSNRSSRRSEDQARSSAESNSNEVAAFERTTQRQKTLEELVVSEAGYISDLKVLIHVRSWSLWLPVNARS